MCKPSICFCHSCYRSSDDVFIFAPLINKNFLKHVKKDAANATVRTFHIEWCIHVGLWFYISCSFLLYFHCDCAHILYSYMFMINRNENVKFMNLIMFDSYSSWRIVTWWYGWVGDGTPWRITWSTTDLSKCSSTSAWCPESLTMWATSTSTSSPSTSPMPRWPVSTMGMSTERWVYIYTQCIMGLPTEIWIYTLNHGLVHWERYVNSVSWACPLRDESSLVYLYKVYHGLAHFLTHRNILFI